MEQQRPEVGFSPLSEPPLVTTVGVLLSDTVVLLTSPLSGVEALMADNVGTGPDRKRTPGRDSLDSKGSASLSEGVQSWRKIVAFVLAKLKTHRLTKKRLYKKLADLDQPKRPDFLPPEESFLKMFQPSTTRVPPELPSLLRGLSHVFADLDPSKDADTHRTELNEIAGTHDEPGTRTIASTKNEPDGYDYLPHKWIATNHSIFAIRWIPLKPTQPENIGKWKEVTNIIQQYYSKYMGKPTTIESPEHVTGSDIFHVADENGKELFLKLYRERLPDHELTTLLDVQEEVAASPIFSHGEYLIPQITTSDQKWVSNGRVGVAYRFLAETTSTDVTHFAGGYVDEIISVGQSLGLLNTLIAKKERYRATTSDDRRNPDRWLRQSSHLAPTF
jgi:hypothetical protein